MDRKQHTEGPQEFTAVLPEPAEWPINGKECLSGPDASSHAECPETRVLICKVSLRLLSNQQTGCWLCSKQACKLLAAERWAAHARSRHSMGTAPRTQWQSVFHCTLFAVLLTLQPGRRVRPMPRMQTCCCGTTHRPLCSEIPHAEKEVSRMSWFSFPGLERKASW